MGDEAALTRAEFFALLPVYSDVAGTEGDDTLVGYYGIDNMQGFGGNDSISGQAGNDALYGDAGNDTVAGEGGDDQLFGGEGDDSLNGGSGDDVLDGGAGDDQLHGAIGHDRILFGYGSGHDTVVQYDGNSDGTYLDTLVFGDEVSIAALRLEKIGNDLLILLGEGEDSIRFTDWFLSTAYQLDAFEFMGDEAALTRVEFLDSLQLYENTTNTWSYKIIDPEDYIDQALPDYSSIETDLSEWDVGEGPFANADDHPLVLNTTLPANANIIWPLNTNIWAHADVVIAEGQQLKMRYFVDNVASIWVNGTLYPSRVGGNDAADLIERELIIPAADLISGSNRIVLLAEDYGAYSYAHVEITVITPSATEVARTKVLANACNGIMPPQANFADRVSNPYADAEFYADPDYADRVTSTQDQMGDPVMVAAMDLVKYESTGIWLDSTAKLCGETDDGRMNLLQHLENAQKLAADEPVVLSTVVFNLPARDCVSGNHPGEFEASEEGLKGYQTYIDTVAALVSSFPDLRFVAAIEPGALASTVEYNQPTVPFSYCEYAFADRIYEQGVTYALNKLGQVPNVYSYLDIGHAAWLGWRVDTLTRTVIDWLSLASQDPALDFEAETNYALISGLVTNVAEYIPYEEPYIKDFDETQPNFGFYSWNAHATAKSYADAVLDKLLQDTQASFGMIIDSSRNGWGGDRRPTFEGTDQSYRLDQRRSRWNWCNNSRAGLGRFPQANPDPDNANLHAFYWFKPPGESDGDDAPVREGIFAEYEVPVKSCTEEYRDGQLNPTPSSHWFDNHFIQLIENAWPPLIEPAKPLAIELSLNNLPVTEFDDVVVSFELPEVSIENVEVYLRGEDFTLTGAAVWEGGFFEVSLADLLFNNVAQSRIQLIVSDVNRQRYIGEFSLGNFAPFTSSEGDDVVIRSRQAQKTVTEIQGFGGDDILIDLLNSVTLNGGLGNDVLQGADLIGGEGNDLLILTGVEVDQKAVGGPGDDEFYVFGRYSQITINDTEGVNRVFLPKVNQDGLQWYREESDLMIEYYNDSDFPEFELTVEEFFNSNPSFKGVYVQDQLWLTPDSISQDNF